MYIASPLHSPSISHTPIQSAGTPTSFGNNSTIGASSESLVEYTRYLQRQNWRLRSQQLVDNLRKLPPIQVRFIHQRIKQKFMFVCLFVNSSLQKNRMT
jgi:hypothetical protein